MARTPCLGLTHLSTSPHYTLRVDRACALVVARRSSEPFRDVAQIGPCFDAVERSLMLIVRSQFRLLVDVRDGPARNDPEFEAAVCQHRGKLLFGFAKNAALALSAAGRLQIQRYADADTRQVFVTNQPSAAFEYLGLPFHDL